MIDMQKIVASSGFVGFRNYTRLEESVTTQGGSLASAAERTNTYTFPLNNDNAVSRVKINYATQSSAWYQLESVFSPFAWGVTTNYDLYTFVNYVSGELTLVVLEVNLTGAPLVIPAQDINITARLFLAPFTI